MLYLCVCFFSFVSVLPYLVNKRLILRLISLHPVESLISQLESVLFSLQNYTVFDTFGLIKRDGMYRLNQLSTRMSSFLNFYIAFRFP